MGPEPGSDGLKSPQTVQPLGSTLGYLQWVTAALVAVFSNVSPPLKSLLSFKPVHCSVCDPLALCLI